MSTPEQVTRAAIDAATELRDPIEDLIERTRTDPGAPFEDYALELLGSLGAANEAEFQRTRERLKKAGAKGGLRVAELDKALDKGNGDSSGIRPSQADLLLEIAQDAELFHDGEESFADVQVDGHRETWAVRSRGFKSWLVLEFFRRRGGAPCADALQNALGTIEARARFDGHRRAVALRVGKAEGKLYLDLADGAWRAVEIGVEGWRVVDAPVVRFVRSRKTLPLPDPVRGGSLEELRRLVNVKRESDFVLVVAWLIAAMRDRGPYPVLAVDGVQGSAKSTAVKILRLLVDPREPDLRGKPRDERDLYIEAKNAHVLAYDNLSDISEWMSDAFCRISTGAGFATRSLYSNDEEAVFAGARPLILNGIEEQGSVSRADLADRSIFVTLARIPDDERRLESEVMAAFEKARPRILGVLLDVVVHGLRELPTTRPAQLPRMADFACWVVACEGALWRAGTFLAAYTENRSSATESAIEADAVSASLVAFLEDKAEWRGTATDLLGELSRVVGEAAAKRRGWPAHPRTLANRIRRVAPALRAIGIVVDEDRETSRDRRRVLVFSRADRESRASSAPSESSVALGPPALHADDSVDEGCASSEAPSDGSPHPGSVPDAADNADDAAPTYLPPASASAPEERQRRFQSQLGELRANRDGDA